MRTVEATDRQLIFEPMVRALTHTLRCSNIDEQHKKADMTTQRKSRHDFKEVGVWRSALIRRFAYFASLAEHGVTVIVLRRGKPSLKLVRA